ncbi:MAG: hypothetical protein R3D62_04695 [Xanthobacteraceae bacterium]
MKWAVFICLLAAWIAPPPAQAQSFNCRYARSADEVLICQNEHLSNLDVVLSRTYYRLRNSLYGAARRRLEASQSRWLASRMDCGRDYACVDRHYQARIRELRNY